MILESIFSCYLICNELTFSKIAKQWVLGWHSQLNRHKLKLQVIEWHLNRVLNWSDLRFIKDSFISVSISKSVLQQIQSIRFIHKNSEFVSEMVNILVKIISLILIILLIYHIFTTVDLNRIIRWIRLVNTTRSLRQLMEEEVVDRRWSQFQVILTVFHQWIVQKCKTTKYVRLNKTENIYFILFIL